MVNWYRVFKLYEEECDREVENIDDALVHLYVERGLSLSDLVSLAEREVLSPRTLRAKLNRLGICIRRRGGANNTKQVYITLDDLKHNSSRELAKKHDVHVTTIYNRKRALLKGKR